MGQYQNSYGEISRLEFERQYCNPPKAMVALHSLTLGDITGQLMCRKFYTGWTILAIPPLPGHIWKRKLHTSLFGLPYAPSSPSLYPLWDQTQLSLPHWKDGANSGRTWDYRAPLFFPHFLKTIPLDHLPWTSFKIWKSEGIISIKDLYTDGIFCLSHSSHQTHLPGSHLFCFFQVRDFVKKNFPHFPNWPPETLLDTLLAVNPKQKKYLSI